MGLGGGTLPASTAGAGGPAPVLHPPAGRLGGAPARPDRPPDLAASVDGCARTVGPCAPYPGLRGDLEAIASEQAARRAAGEAGPEVLIDVLGVPAWAAAPPSGCEPPGATAIARVLAPGALSAYRGLIGDLVSLAHSEGLALNWWSPWNEPNDPSFLSPQRGECDVASPPLSPSVYAQLARAMAQELRAEAPGAAIVLGELNGGEPDSPHATSVESFVAALPGDVLCLASAWSVHAYAVYGPGAGVGAAAGDPISALEGALARRGGCAAKAPVWITETGAGAPHPGAPPDGSPAQELEACRALAALLGRWSEDPRVAAVFQYSFPDDPAFPVGLLSADLRRLHPSYGLWLALAAEAGAGGRARPDAGACGR